MDVRLRQRLTRGEHDDVEVGGFEAAPCDLVADEERIVGARRVGERHRKGEWALVEISVCVLGDVGKWTERRVAGEVAGADVARQQLGVEALEAMRASEQLRKIRSQPHDGAVLNRFDMAAEQIRLKARVQTLR